MNQRPPRFDWQETWSKNAYSEKSDQPYGTRILHRVLEGYHPGNQFTDIRQNLPAELPLDSLHPATYFFVGGGVYLDSISTAHLLAFVQAGNTAFLSSKTIPFDLMFHLYYEECGEAGWDDYATVEDTMVHLGLEGDSVVLELFYAQQNQPELYDWGFIEKRFFCEQLPQKPLGFLNDSLANFASFPYGKGRFLLHTTPIALSNYQLLRPEARQYAEALLAYLPKGKIYWDTYNRVPEMVARRRNENGRHNASRQLPAEHPLSYMLQQAPLAWAWYLLLALAAAYLVFRAKRRQRVVPVLAKNENSSYEFISTIANLHFREKNYQNLCIQNMRLFLAQLHDRYGLVAKLDSDTLKLKVDPGFEHRLSLVSEIPVQQIQDIFTQYTAAVQYEPTEDMMIQFYLSIDRFLKTAK